MNKSLPLLFAACLISTLCGCSRNSASDSKALPSELTDADLLKGTWEITAATINGESFPVEGQADIHIGGRYQFDDRTLTKFANPEFPGVDQNGTQHRYHINAETNPRQIEIQMLDDGPNGPWPPEKTIYKLEKDSLLHCWSIIGESIPDAFESKPGANIGLYELQRIN